ncbi:InlB B-repeat-containing protein [Peptoniphilus vaginalis]|uniref:InlB B-repeat-containing protein n=1 Tax=Peptoniphilus vaginalis TaxID=1756987 RepID=UPI0023F69745|nr:InlB B-repeat-containing protein [Peptoniphilus vaginalis]
MPHHIDFWLDDFDGNQVIDYDLYTIKSDVDKSDYHDFLPPDLQGFTPKNSGGRGSEFKEDSDLDDLNEEREEITAPKHVNIIHNPESDEDEKDYKGKLKFMKNFPGDDKEFDKNGYLKFEYSRNKYPLRFNYDPSKIKGDNEFFYPAPNRKEEEKNKANALETFYEFPLKCLSPDLFKPLTEEEKEDGKKQEYFKDNHGNFLDNPNNLYKLGLYGLLQRDKKDSNKLFQDEKGNYKVKRPKGLSDQMVFKGWALDPAGTKLVSDKKSEKMPSHAVNLYAKWGAPDNKWKVTIDPNGGYLSSVKAKDLTKTTKTIQEGDIGQEEEKTYPIKEKNDGKKQIFTVVQRQQLNKLEEPQRWGYDFLGWEWVKFNEDGTEDKTYSNEYKVPELYSFGNDLVSDVYLRAIWVRNDLQTVMAYHHILDKDLKEVPGSPESQELPKRRKGYFSAALGSKQGSELTLVPKAQWEALKQSNDTFKNYYNEETGRTNNYFQVHEIKGPLEVEENGTKVEKNDPANDFHFFYIPYRKREYKVNYLDERCKADVEKFIAEAKNKFKENYEAIKNDSNKTEDQKKEAYRNLIKVNEEYFERIVSKYSIIAPETVINGKRHYDARNYRHIPGWTLAENESPQQQLFFNVDESTNEFLGINGTGLGEIFFFYQDARVIEVKNPEDKVPEGYVRVTFKADKGGSFGKDAKGDDIKVLYYDVIKGLKSDSLPVPQKWEGLDNLKDKDKNYITPDYGKNFVKWDNKPLLNKGTILQTADNNFYVFTAYFDWSGLSTSSTGLVRTEAFKDPNNQWTNDFAPKIEDLKKQLVWKEKDKVKPIPAGTKIEFVYKDDAGKETKINTDEDVFNLVKEMGKEDKDEVVRVVNIVAKVTFEEGKKAQELLIPIIVYKNRYEALNKEWQKPKYLSDAEGKDAKDGGLKDVTGNYVKVTVSPTGDMKAKDNKVYYVNPKAWVEIPEVKADGSSTFINWTADQVGQNDDGKGKGKFDFAKRHKFTEDTIITPVGAGDVVEQEKGKDKPDVPKSYVKVIVKTTDKATDETAFEKTFWVNPTKEVTIQITEPTGKENQKVTIDGLGEKDVNYIFKEWQKVKTGEADDKLTDVTPAVKVDLAKNKFTDKVTVIEAAYKKSIQAKPIVEPLKTKKLDTPQGKEITDKDLIDKITPPENKEIESITVVEKPDPSKPGKQEAKVTIKYKDGTTQGTNDNPVVIPVEVHKNIIPEAPGGQKPKDALDNYVKVIFKAGEGGKLDKTLTGNFVYYVSPEVEVDMTDTAKAITKTANIGYFVNGEKWTNTDNKTLKGTFTDPQTEFVFNFDKSDDIVEKTDDPNQVIPKDYVKVTFKTEDEAKGKLAENKLVKIYYVNPKAGIKLVELAEGTQAAEKQLAVPKTVPAANYEFDKWYESIDKENPITNNREYVARFVKGGVNLTYDANGATGTVPSKVIVAQGTSVRLASAAGLSKKDYTFAGWKFDGDDKLYQAGDEVTLDKNKKAVAQWKKDEDIISYNPEEPKARPDGYVRVTFVAEKGLNLENVKHYYVKKNAGIKLGNTELVKPGVKAETGYEFDKWNPEDTTEIKDTDVVVKAKARELDSFIHADGNKKPDGYVTVTFVAGDNGSLDGVQKYYVNPTKYVAFNPPKAIGNTGYEFASWSQNSAQNTNYKEDTTITATFNQIGEVSLVEKPGYVKVDFVIKGQGGSILNGQTKTYYVDPNRAVTLKAPVTSADVGYEFASWSPDPAAEKKYAQATNIEGTFKKLDDIIPATDDQGKENAKPEGYVTLTFEKGNGGKTITGKTIYYVNPKANTAKTLAEITKPNVSPDTGYKITGWDTENSFKIKADKTVTATYEELPLVSDTKLPGYVKVTFDTTSKGLIEETSKTEKIVYVNPNKPVILKGHEPKITPTTNNVFARWDVNLTKETFFKDGDRITAQYYDKTIISVTEVKDFVKVVFDKGDNGDLTGTKTYWVKPGVDVTVPAPTVNPNTGYEFNNWTHSLSVNLSANSPTYTIKAEYKALEDIIECDKIRPNGYVKVEFVSYGNGKLIGNRSYYVNPNKNVDLTSKADAIFKNPNVGYTEIGGNWSNDKSKNLNDTFSEDVSFKYNFKELKGVDTTNHPGYVKVEFIAGENGQIVGGNKTYYVNPKKNIKVGSNELAIPDTNPNTNYEFDKWFTGIDKTNPVTSDRTYIAQFKLSKATLTYVADDKTSGTVPAELTYDIGTVVTLAGGNDLKKDNYVLKRWNIDGAEYAPGAKFTINGNTTATAVWEAGLHTVNFDTVGGTHIDSQKVKHGEKITEVTNPQKEGYFFTGWTLKGQPFNPKTDKVTEDITLVAQYSKDIIPQTGTDKPAGVPKSFVSVEFKEGTNGNLTGTTKYWVNPAAGKKLSDIVHPTVTANDGWKNTGWDNSEDTEIKSALEVTAQYLEKVLTSNPNDAENYVKVDFEQGEHGTIAADATKAYWVLKNEAVSLTAPTVTAKEGYAQKANDDAWSPKLATSYSSDTIHTAQYVYNGKDVIPQKGIDQPNNVPKDFVLVEFNQGEHGTIASTETTKYWVNPEALVTLTPPQVKANSGYELERGYSAWDKYLTNIFSKATTITAQYRKVEVPTPPTPEYPGGPDYPPYPGGPIPIYPEVRRETIIQEKVVKVPVPVSDNYFKEVRYMQGFNGYFRPNDGLTRAEAAQILANALVEDGYKYNPNFKISYKDVGEAWYTRAVKIVTEANVFAGYDDGNFKPQAKITRNEWIATLKRFQELGDASGNNMKLRDGHWAKGEIQAAFNEGWLKIYTDGLATYKGDEFIPRQEVAAVSNKAFKRMVDKTYIGKNNLSLVTYKDVTTSMWAYEDILCASNTFLDRKDRYIAHWVKEDKNQFNIDTSDFKIVQKNFQRNPR